MEYLFILGLILVVTAILPWINWARISSLTQEVEDLRNEISTLKSGQTRTHPYKRIQYSDFLVDERRRASETLEDDDAPLSQDALAEEYQPEHTEHAEELVYEYPPDEHNYVRENRVEFNLGAKLPVWIGAISLICAAYFLVKYSLESGLLGPAARISIGMLAGLAMTAAGHFISRRPHISNYQRIAQGLTGAGIVSLYGCLYGAVNLYGMMPPAIGFAGMCAVTAVAIISSVRIGQPIAVFALIGGLLTPALMKSDEPNSLMLFLYLFILFSGLSVVMLRNGWWFLSLLSLLGVFSWTSLWFLTSFNQDESTYMLLMLAGVVCTVLAQARRYFLTDDGDDGQKAAHYPPILTSAAIAGTALTIAALSFRMSLGLFDWGLLGLLGTAVMALTYLRPSIYGYGLYAMMALHMALYALWLFRSPGDYDLIIFGCSAILYCVVPQFFIMRSADPRRMSGVQTLSAAALYAIAYHYLGASDLIMAAASLLLAGFSIWQIRHARSATGIDEKIRNDMIGIYAFTANAFIAAGFAILLPGPYLPTAFALQAACALWIYTHTRISMLDAVAFLLTALFVFTQYEQLLLFATVITKSITGQVSSYFPTHYILSQPLIGLGIPAIALIAGFAVRTRFETVGNIAVKSIAIVGGAAGLATCYYLILRLTPAVSDTQTQADFFERSCVSFMIAAWAVTIALVCKQEYRKWGIFLFHVFIARIVWFDLLLNNPYLDSAQKVGSWPLLNGITLTYLGALLLNVWALYRHILPSNGFSGKTYGAFTITMLLAFISLTIRHAFNGENMMYHSGMEAAELYTYSAIWLITGAAILWIAIMRNSHAMRIASFAVISLTVLKVFLIDAGNLEGLYRVLSFAGLGISLIALSYFYTRFVRSGAGNAEPQ